MQHAMSPLVPARVAFSADGIPYSADYDDVYHSADGGLDQARHVFLGGNALPERWHRRESFTILETGFGLGLNFLACWQALRDEPPGAERLHFVSVEKHPFHAHDLEQLHRRWPQLDSLFRELIAAWPPLIAGFHRLHLDGGRVTLTLLLGEAKELLPQLDALVDAFFLDGFAPAKNPDLWSSWMCKELARLARPGATLATYTVAGAVRDALQAAGFATQKQRGFGAKREMLTGHRPGHEKTMLALRDKRAIVIGGGLAGTSCAQRFAARGWQVDIMERNPAVAMEASAIPSGVLRPLVHGEDTVQARLSRGAMGYTIRHLRTLEKANAGLAWGGKGLLHLALGPGEYERFQQMAEHYRFPTDFVRLVDAAEARQLAGQAVGAGGYWFPHGAWVSLPGLCSANLAASREHARVHVHSHASRLAEQPDGWRVFDPTGRAVASAPVVILANASDCARIAQAACLPFLPVRGQVSLFSARPGHRLDIAITGEGYIAPTPNGGYCVGATFERDDHDMALRVVEHIENLARAEALIPGFAAGLEASALGGQVAQRCTTPDRMPVFGELRPGLYAATGMGARGLLWAQLGAELLASLVCGDPLPMERDLVATVDPGRFLRAGETM